MSRTTILTTANVAAKIRQEAHIKATNSAEEHVQPAEISISCNKNNQCKHKNTISSLAIGLKMSYFPLIRFPSCYRTVCYWIVCYWTVCYRTV